MIKLKYTTVLPRRFITTLRSIKNLISSIMLLFILEVKKKHKKRKSITCEMREFLIKKKHSRAFVSVLHLLLKPHSSCEAAVPEVVDLVDLAAAGRLVLVVSEEEEEEEEDDLLDRLPFRMRRRIETMRFTIQTTKATKRIIIIIISMHSSNQKPPNSS